MGISQPYAARTGSAFTRTAIEVDEERVPGPMLLVYRVRKTGRQGQAKINERDGAVAGEPS